MTSTRTIAALLAAVALAGCASVRSPDPRDPWEPMNRGIFEFNDGLDRAVFKPVAEGYRFVLPEPVRDGVRNFYSNLRDPWIALNQLLQGKFEPAVNDMSRFLWNTTIGLLGIFDWATDMGLPKHNEDFGQTLAVWGVDFGPYFVIPILGPSSARDGSGLVVDSFAYLPWYLPKWIDPDNHLWWSIGFTAVDFVQTRANLLDATTALEEAALDRYAFTRDAYFQRRRYLIHDGNPPPLPAGDRQSELAPRPPLIEPKLPANYESVLAAGARRVETAHAFLEPPP
jgi:phospholipid-binding lipoprotein MlaA